MLALCAAVLVTLFLLPARADDMTAITDCDRHYYAHILAGGEAYAAMLPRDLPSGVAPLTRLDRSYSELLTICLADAGVRPGSARLARAVAELSRYAGTDPAPWYLKAAELWDPLAMHWLGRELRATDPRAAHRWAVRAADADYAPGVYLLAETFETGIGVAADPDRAMQLYERSAELGWWAAAYRLALLHVDRPEVASIWYGRAVALSAGRPHHQAEVMISEARLYRSRDPKRPEAGLSMPLPPATKAWSGGWSKPARLSSCRRHSRRSKLF